MEQPSGVTRFPLLSYGRVYGYDVPNHAVLISLSSMQTISVSAKVLVNGPADSSRIEQNPLPVIGTIGLVAFPFGDTRGAIWLGSIIQSYVNAATSSNPPTDEDSQIKYMSHASGAFSYLDYGGNFFYHSADGSSVAINSDGNEPVTYRHNVNGSGQQVLQAVGDSFRNPDPPGPFTIQVKQAGTGAAITIDSSGNIVATQANGTSTLTLDSSGNYTFEGGQDALYTVTATNIILETAGASVIITPDLVEISPALQTFSTAQLYSIT